MEQPDAMWPDGAPVGHPCNSGVSDPGAPNSYNQPADECPLERLCVHIQDTMPDLCTTRCENDHGCAKVLESPCLTFSCLPVFDVGDHACEKLCVCTSYVPLMPSGDAGFGTFCPM
jgi:hypothetical protein